MSIQRLALVGLLLLVPALASAQSYTVSGRVRDAATREPLPGVTVLVPNTTLGVATDRDGAFTLRTDRPVRMLVVSIVGYRTRTVEVADAPLDILLDAALVDLQDVVVSASRTAVRRTEAPVAVAALSRTEIEQTRARMPYELLNKVPGVYIADFGNEQHSTSIRQPLSLKALYAFLDDGLPVRPVGLFNHNALNEVNFGGADRIEVVRGPSSALFGANAVGGAINVLAPRPPEVPEARLTLRHDDRGQVRADASAGVQRGRVGVWVGGYGARQRDGYAAHSDYDKVALSLRADVQVRPGTALRLDASVHDLRTDMTGSLDSASFFGQNLTSLHSFTYRDVDARRAALRLNHAWNARHATEIAFFGRDNAVGQMPSYRVSNDRRNPARATGEVNEQAFTSVGVAALHRAYLAPRFNVTLGALLDRSPSTYWAEFAEIARDPATGRYLSYSTSDSLLTRYDVLLVNAGAYAVAEVRPVERLRLSASLRYDLISYDYDNHLPPTAFSGAPDDVATYRRLTPRVGATYEIADGQGVYASYGQGFMPPEVSELYRGVKVPTLRPSYFDSYETGGWAAFWEGRLQADLALYRMDGRDEIISVRLDDGTTENANAGRTRHTGVEYGLTAAPVAGLTLRLSGTNARHTFTRYEEGGVRFDGNEMPGAPTWIVNAEATLRPRALRGAYASVETQHLSGYFTDPANRKEYSGYTILNTRVGAQWRGVQAWMSVLNLTDRLYSTYASASRFGASYYLGAPRTVAFGLGYHFGR